MKIPAVAPEPKFEEFAAELKARREASGLSLEDLFDRTRINRTFLTAIEAGNFGVLPDVYTRLFLKTYAQEIGLDPKEVLRRYAALVPAAPVATGGPPSVEPARPEPSVFTIGVGVIFLAAVGALAYNLWESPDASSPDVPAVQGVSPRTQTPRAGPSQVKLSVETPGAGLPEARPSVEPPEVGPSQVGPSVETPGAGLPEARPSVEPPEVGPSAGLPPVETPETGPPEARPSVETPGAGPPRVKPSAESPDGPPEAGLPQGHESAPPAEEDLELANGPDAEWVAAAYALTPGPDLDEQDTVLVLSGQVLRPTRVAVSADGEPVFEGALAAGAAPNWDARRRFRVEVQEASAFALSLQGQPLGLRVAPGRKLRLFISRSSIWVEEIEPRPGPGADF